MKVIEVNSTPLMTAEVYGKSYGYIYIWIHGKQSCYIMLYPKYDFKKNDTTPRVESVINMLTEATGSAGAFVVLASLHCGAGDGLTNSFRDSEHIGSIGSRNFPWKL